MSEGFVKLPRSLLQNTDWIDARPTHKTVFLTILEHAAFKETTHRIRRNKIIIKPGQLCVSLRKLKEWCGKWITVDDVRGALEYFSLTQILTQEVPHGKTLLTIIESSLCEQCFNISPTNSPIQVPLKSHTKEEYNTDKTLDDDKGFAKTRTLSSEESKLLEDCMQRVAKHKITSLQRSSAKRLILQYGAASFKFCFKETFLDYKSAAARGKEINFGGLLTQNLKDEKEYGTEDSTIEQDSGDVPLELNAQIS